MSQHTDGEPARPRAGSLLIRPAVRSDVPALLGLVHELAEYERAPDAVQASAEDLRLALFGTPPAAAALVAEEDSFIVGMALYFHTFSTWTGRRGMHLEDLYVTPSHRGRGTGRALLAALAQRCLHAGLPRLEWAVLTWNTPAIGFYRGLGAVHLEDWASWRLAGPALAALASGAASPEPPATPTDEAVDRA